MGAQWPLAPQNLRGLLRKPSEKKCKILQLPLCRDLPFKFHTILITNLKLINESNYSQISFGYVEAAMLEISFCAYRFMDCTCANPASEIAGSQSQYTDFNAWDKVVIIFFFCEERQSR